MSVRAVGAWMQQTAACMEGLETRGLGDEAAALLLQGNARKVFKLDSVV